VEGPVDEVVVLFFPPVVLVETENDLLPEIFGLVVVDIPVDGGPKSSTSSSSTSGKIVLVRTGSSEFFQVLLAT